MATSQRVAAGQALEMTECAGVVVDAMGSMDRQFLKARGMRAEAEFRPDGVWLGVKAAHPRDGSTWAKSKRMDPGAGFAAFCRVIMQYADEMWPEVRSWSTASAGPAAPAPVAPSS